MFMIIDDRRTEVIHVVPRKVQIFVAKKPITNHHDHKKYTNTYRSTLYVLPYVKKKCFYLHVSIFQNWLKTTAS